ncbi:hypothetical protein [Arthrobacter sp. N199823]|uniref:hypothetical protein n=1 Tax=Arthrobacter sp. N199823 TaxID=2058895 RepID=UPI000CE36A55|nr:hypothetical protein [Arthrobacter sp. N199823]
MNDGKLEKIISRAAESLGAVGATGIGLLLSSAGPEAAAFIGGAAGPLVAGIANDVAHRMMSKREEHRLGGVMVFALESMEALRADGGRLRSDAFWATDGGYPSPGEEVIEAVLMAAKREPQEKKLEYFGCLLAQIAYSDNISVETAMVMVNMAERLTWTPYVLISMVGRKDEFDLEGIEVGQGIASWKGWAIHDELRAMGPFGLSIMGAPSKKTPRMNLPLINMELSDFALGNGGRLLYDFLGVGDIAADEINSIIGALREDLQQATAPASPAE